MEVEFCGCLSGAGEKVESIIGEVLGIAANYIWAGYGLLRHRREMEGTFDYFERREARE